MIVGGAQENTLLNCLDLIRMFGDEVLLVTGPAQGPEGDLLSQGRGGELRVEYVDSLIRPIHPMQDWKAVSQLRKTIRQFGPDVVHTHSAKGGLLGRVAAHAESVPAIIHTVHGAPFHPYQSALARVFFQACERWASRRCDRLISVADAMTDLMVSARVAPREKFTTIYSGMDVEPFVNANVQRAATRQEFGFTDEHIVIGKIARLFHLKGHDDVLEAARSLIESCPTVRFLWVGDGILKEPLVQRMEQLGIRDHFVLTGLVPPSEVPRMIGAMDILVHASYREGLARALPQALIAGKPVVSYDCDGAREVVTPETGFLVPAGDRHGLGQGLRRLVQAADLRTRMGRAGQDRFTDQFRHQTMTRQVRELYERVLASKR